MSKQPTHTTWFIFFSILNPFCGLIQSILSKPLPFCTFYVINHKYSYIIFANKKIKEIADVLGTASDLDR